MCRGSRPSPVKTTCQNGWGLLNTTLTEWLSIFSTRATSSKPARVLVALAGSVANCQLKITSSAVKGAPSCQTTPFLSRQVTDRPPLANNSVFQLGILADRQA